MNKLVLALLLTFSAVLAFGSGLALPVGKVTRLTTKDLPDVPGKRKAWSKPSTSLPARSPNHIDITQIFLCTC